MNTEKTKKFQIIFSHVEKLVDRRQSTTSFYLSVNTAVVAVVGLILKDASIENWWLNLAVLALLSAGLFACWIWRSLLQEYKILLAWWYARLREFEEEMPDSAKLVTREYDELYMSHRKEHKLGMTEKELLLNWVLTALYTIFIAGILYSWLFL